MTDMESLDRAVEEARNGWHRAEESPDFIVWRYYEDGECHGAVTLPKEVEAAVSAKARAEERERQKQFHAADGAGMVYASKAAAGMIERIIDEEDAYYHGVPWEEIRRWIKSGEDLWAIYLIGEAHMLATDHQSEVAALSVAGRRGIDQWRTCSSEEAGNGS